MPADSDTVASTETTVLSVLHAPIIFAVLTPFFWARAHAYATAAALIIRGHWSASKADFSACEPSNISTSTEV